MKLVKGHGLHLSGEDFYDFRRDYHQFTLNGENVRSAGEKFIADYLFEHGIYYKYEPSFRMASEGRYSPDFTIWLGKNDSKKGYAWEHWAFNPNCHRPDRIDGWDLQKMIDYKDDIKRKRKYWSDKNGWSLIESHSDIRKIFF